MNQHAAWTVLNKHSGFLPSLPPKKLLQPVAPVKSLQVLIIWCPRLQQWKRFDILLTFCSKSVPFFPTQRHGVRRPEVIGWQSEACETIWLSHIAYWNNFLIYIIYIIIYNWYNHCTLPDRVLFTWLVVESDLSIISYTKTSWWNRRWLFVISKSSQCIWGRNLWSLWSQRSNVRTSAGGASNSGWFLFWSHWGLHRIRITLSSRDVGNPGILDADVKKHIHHGPITIWLNLIVCGLRIFFVEFGHQVRALEKVCTDLVAGAKAKEGLKFSRVDLRYRHGIGKLQKKCLDVLVGGLDQDLKVAGPTRPNTQLFVKASKI